MNNFVIAVIVFGLLGLPIATGLITRSVAPMSTPSKSIDRLREILKGDMSEIPHPIFTAEPETVRQRSFQQFLVNYPDYAERRKKSVQTDDPTQIGAMPSGIVPAKNQNELAEDILIYPRDWINDRRRITRIVSNLEFGSEARVRVEVVEFQDDARVAQYDYDVFLIKEANDWKIFRIGLKGNPKYDAYAFYAKPTSP